MYIRTSKKQGGRNARIISVIMGCIVVVIVIFQFFIPHFIPAIVTTIVRPFWRMEFSVSNGSLYSPESLLAENAALKIKLAEVMTADIGVDIVRSQNTELLGLLGRSDSNLGALNFPVKSNSTLSSTTLITSTTSLSTNYIVTNIKGVLAAVLVHPPFAPYDEFIIDIGSDHAIQPGAKVYAPGNILIGTTTDVLGETSKVRLFSSPGESYSVLIGPNHIPATAIGRGGGQYEAQIPQATNISQGDIVLDTTISDGLFGTVTSVISNPANPFETILFSPPINVYQLRFVLVDNSVPTTVSSVPKVTTSTIVAPVSKASSTKTKK